MRILIHQRRSLDLLRKLINDVGLSCKGWTFSGSDPPAEVAEDNMTVSIGGMRSHPN